MASRKQQQGELIFQLGSLLGPFLDITNNPSKFPTELRFKTRAKYMSDVNLFKEQVQNFVNGEAGYSYEIEWRKIQDEIDSFADNTLKNDFGNIPVFAQKLDIFRQNMLNELLSIPTSFETEVFNASSPFTTYCFLRDLCQTAKKQFILVDRYLDDTVFYRYLRHLPDTVKLTLVTWSSAKFNANIWSQLIDVSRLYATEHPTTYRLMTHDNLHDRWLYCDHQSYMLGGSLKDAGIKSNFTLTKLDIPFNLEHPINQIRNTALELFGQENPQHP